MTKISEINYIEALGNFLATYRADLRYISKFKHFKSEEISIDEYLLNNTGSFQRFINEFRVARNISKHSKREVLFEIKKWVNKPDSDNVDSFARLLCNGGFTHEKIMTSLCSKILFLNNPYKVIPIDQLAKNSLNYKGNLYEEFKPLLNNFKLVNDKLIDKYLNSVEKYTIQIEYSFIQQIENIEIIRRNRFIDKILWTKGKG